MSTRDTPERTLEIPERDTWFDGPIPVLVNRRAGGGAGRALRGLAAALAGTGVATELLPVEPRRLAGEVARAAVRRPPRVGVAGGDGSIRTAAEVLAGSGIALAPIPLGTLNHFARRLGLGEVGRAVHALAAGGTTRVPVGVVDDHLFLNTATFGLYADVVRRRDRIRRRLTRWPAALVASLATLARMRSVEVTLDVGGSRLRRTTPLVWVGIGRRSFPLVHQAPLDGREAELEVVVVREGGGLATAALLARGLRRLLRREHPAADPALEVFHARSLLLDADARVGATLDGEVFRWRPPLFIAVQESGLRVTAAPTTAARGAAPA